MVDKLRVRLQLLGPFGVRLEGGPSEFVDLPAGRTRALLVYLAMQPGRCDTRERLATRLWGDGPDKQARQSLRQCILVLKKHLETLDLLQIERDSIALRHSSILVDAHEFEALAQSNQPADWEQAAELYAGPFLEGSNLNVEGFDDWVCGERVRLQSLAADVFEKCTTFHDQSREGARAILAAERLVALDRLRESSQRLLIHMLARYRGRDAALSHADAFTKLLREDLGVSPEAETRSLIAELKYYPASAVREIPIRDVASGRSSRADAPPRKIRRSGPAMLAWSIGSAAVSVALVLALLSYGTHSVSPGAGPAAPTKEGADDVSWRSPRLASNIAGETKALAAQAVQSIVVLPFTTDAPNDSPEARLASRLTEDLINDLSRAPNARVISPQTSRLYAGRRIDIAAIGAELGVHYAVEGSLRLEGASLRINAALTDVTTRLQVWSDRLDRDGADRRAVQDEITRGITRRLQINILAAEDRRRPPTQSEPGIADLLAKGWAATTRISMADKTTGADTYFEEVLGRDPDNVSALTGLAAFHIVGSAMFLSANDAAMLEKAEALLSRAINLNPYASLPYYYRGVLEKTRARSQAALEAFDHVLQLNPSYAPAYAQIGQILSRRGQLNEALEHVRYAIRLSPKDHNIGLWCLFGGEIELERGHDEAALEWLSRASDASPRSPFVQAALAAATALQGDRENAKRYAAEARKLAPWLTREAMIARLTGLSTPGSEPRRLIEGLRKAFAGEG